MPRHLLALLIAHFFVVAGIGAIGTTVALDLSKSGLSSLAIGLLQSLYYVGLVIGGFSANRIYRRFGPAHLFAASAAIACATSLVHLASLAPWEWALARMALGLSAAGVYASLELAFNRDVVNALRGRLFSWYQIVTYGATAFGQLFVGFDQIAGVSTYLVGALLCGAALACSSVLLRIPSLVQGSGTGAGDTRAGGHGHGYAEVWRASVLGVCTVFLSGVFLGSYYTTYPVVVTAVSQSIDLTGRIMAASLFFALMTQWPSAAFADKFGRPLGTMIVAAAILTTALVLAIEPAHSIDLVGLLFVGLIFCIYTLGVADVNDKIADAHRSQAATALVVVFSVGGITGPTIASIAYSLARAEGYFALMSACSALLVVGAAASYRARRA